MKTFTLVLTLLLASQGERTPPPDAGEGACLECHGELLEGAVVHGAAEMEQCGVCHVAAGEGHTFDVAVPVIAACLECHDDPRDATGHVHGPVTTGDCTACHDPHRSEEASLLLSQSPALCWSCHGTVRNRPAPGQPVRNVRREIAEAAIVHGAVEAGCDACHPAHASPREGLFADSFPGGPYAVGHEASYDLCFNCHDEEILEEDPEGTEFRDGERNLHFVHVARRKSRSCALCHSAHGGGEHLLRGSVRFGSWDMPLTWEATPEGGSCLSACHESRFYRRPLEPPPGAPDAETEP